MVPEQKRAWITAVLAGIALAGFFVCVPLIGWRIAAASFGVIGFAGLTPLLFRKKSNPAEVATDERDKMIAEKATLAGGIASFQVMLLGCMVPWFICMFQGREVISIYVLPNIVFAGMVGLYGVRAVAMLILYGREPGHGED